VNPEPAANQFPIYHVTVNDPAEGQVGLITFLSPEEIEKAGGLPPQVIVGRQLRLADGLAPDNFGRNRAFLDFFHAVIREVVPTVPEFQGVASSMGYGWFNLQDGRSTLKGLTMPPEDLIGRYRVFHGRFVPGEYEPHSGYWVLTENGMMTPHPLVAQAVLQTMRSLRFTQNDTGPRWERTR
jgi:hypothetical protein